MANVIVPLADCLFRLKKIKKRQVIKDESLFNVCNILFRQQIGPFFCSCVCARFQLRKHCSNVKLCSVLTL